MGSMQRMSLLLITGLLALSATAFASDEADPIQAALEEPAQDSLIQNFSVDLTPQPLQENSTQGYKIAAVEEFLPIRSEAPSVLGEVKNFAEGAVKVVIKSPFKVLDGFKTVIDL